MSVNTRKAGIIVLGVGFVLAGLMILLWLVGFVVHIGGGLIHLLLVLALLLAGVSAVTGVILIALGKSSK